VAWFPDSADLELTSARTSNQETRVARGPADRKRLARGTESEKETRVAPPPERLLREVPEGEKETRVGPQPQPAREVPDGEKETRVEPPPQRHRRRNVDGEDGETLSLRGNRWSRQRPTTGVGSRPHHVRARLGSPPAEVISSARRPSEVAGSRQTRHPSPALANETLQLPVAILLFERMKLRPSKAAITDISRAAAFVSCNLQPLAGRRLVMRVASDVGVGVAVGYVQATFEGAGFAVRVNASTDGYRAYVDALRAFSDGGSSPQPTLCEPISMQIL